ncbi:MAG: T9SS type A sorting domain-containing protein [Ginsengibacter sp.]
MKKLFLMFLLACAIQSTNAQVYDTTTFQGKADYYLQYVDKAQIPTQILYDRVFPIARLDAFNQGTSDTSSYGIFMQALSELRNASYSTTNVPLTNDVEALVTQQRLLNKVPISIAHYQFNWIDTLALQNNLLRIQSGLLYDVVGRPYSPYKTKITTIAAALTDSVPAGSIVFILPTYLQLKNTSEVLTNVDITFGDGNPVTTLAPGGTVTVNYSNPGDKIIKYLAHFSNGTQQITYSYISIIPATANGTSGPQSPQGPDPLSLPCSVTNVRAAIAFQGYDETTAAKGEGEVNTYYANCSDPTLRKPVIILDGFDPGNTRDASKIYENYLSYTDNSGIPQNLVKSYRAQGYDIIILNFPKYIIGTHTFPGLPGVTIPDYRDGGADYIERNAFVLARLIDSVNAKLTANGSTQKLVIVGPSMGGLISRYALAYMEQHSMPSNTRLWVSFDAPHNGANIAMGDQHFLEYYSTKVGGNSAKKALNDQINSPAAKQLLLHHYLSNSEVPAGAPNFRTRFVQAMTTIGFPGIPGNPALRRIAIINGSGNGSKQIALGLSRSIIPCEKMFTTEIKLSKGVRLLFFLSSFFFPPLFGLSAPITISAAKAYYTPEANNRCLSFEGTYLGYASKNWYSTALNSGAGLDEAPGGYINTQKDLADSGKETRFFAKSQVKFYSVIPNQCFIPSKSALAFTGANTDLGENLIGRNLVCTGETPFQSYFTPLTNESHVSLSQASVTWVTNEINGIPQQPTYDIPTLAITGPSLFCPSGTFSITGGTVPSGTSLVWNPGSIATIGSGQGTTQVRLDKITTGTANLTVTLSKTCGINKTLTKPYSISGYSSGDYPVSGPSSACKNTYVTYSTNTLPGAISYTWFYPGGGTWTYVSGQNTPSITLITGATTGNYQVGVRVANACDAGGSYAIANTFVNNCGSFAVDVSPNPTDGEMTVATTAVGNSSKTTADKIYKIRIVDVTGTTRKMFIFSGTTTMVKINLTGLNKGVYQLSVNNGNQWSTKKIIVK